MGKESTKAPAPDPNIGKAALQQAQTGQDMLDFYKQAYTQEQARQATTDNLADQVTQQQLSTSQQQAQWASEDRSRYVNEFEPLQDNFVNTAENWDSSNRQQQMADEAKADVANNAAATTAANNRSMEAMGVNPNSGRFAGINRSAAVATGLAEAGAQNTARNNVRSQALSLQQAAVNMGNGLPATATSSASLGVSAGSAALGTNQAANSQYLQGTSLMGQGFSGQLSGLSASANTYSNLYQDQLSSWQATNAAKAQNASSIMSGIGTLAGAAAGFM